MRSWVTTSMFFLYVTTLRFGRGCGWLTDRLLAPNLKRSWLPTIDPFEASPAVAAWRLTIPSWTTPTITDIITSSSSLSHLLHRSHQPSNRIGWLTWLSSPLIVAYCTTTISGEEHQLLQLLPVWAHRRCTYLVSSMNGHHYSMQLWIRFSAVRSLSCQVFHGWMVASDCSINILIRPAVLVPVRWTTVLLHVSSIAARWQLRYCQFIIVEHREINTGEVQRLCNGILAR